MGLGPEAISLRLTANQVSLISSGLDFIFRSDSIYRDGKASIFSYPLRLCPPPDGFNQGKFSQQFMNLVLSLARRMRSRVDRGGRFRMSSIEIRAAIFGVRINADWLRFRKQAQQRLSGRKSSSIDIGVAPEVQLKKRTAETISTLERHLKRANYRLLSIMPRGDYDNLTKRWRAHIRWMRLHLAYFQTLRPEFLTGKKRARQLIVDDLTAIAVMAIRREGYELPDAVALRKVIRQFLAYSRRGRLPYQLTYMLNKKTEHGAANILFRFVEQRLNLVEVEQ
jgi:hypothetical protein